MKQGKTISGDIITLNGNTVSIIDLKNNHMQSTKFLTKEHADEYFKRYNVCKTRGRKKLHKIPQATIYYNQLIIQL